MKFIIPVYEKSMTDLRSTQSVFLKTNWFEMVRAIESPDASDFKFWISLITLYF